MPSRLNGDASRIRQVVTNFLVNAVKYTEHGTVTLTADTEKADEKGNVILRLSVSDTGVGIKPEDMAYLFKKFSRGSARAEKSGRSVEGIGLGLAIAKELSHMMGGEINVESVSGEGSTFTFRLPQGLIDSGPLGNWGSDHFPAPIEKTYSEVFFMAPGGRILAVDDNPGNLRVIQEFLGRTGLHIDTSGGYKCIEAVRKAAEGASPYHVILMDYMMQDWTV